MYRPPLRDLRFALDLVGADRLSDLESFRHVDTATVDSLLAEFGRLIAQEWAPLNRVGDREGLRVDLATSSIRTPTGFVGAYRAWVDAGWGSVTSAPGDGGGGFPHVVGLAMAEMMQSANMALALCPMLTQGAIEALTHHASEIQRERYLRRLASGEWAGTMNLTEPQAGSDVGALMTKAWQEADGTWRVSGQKIYITWGEHDLTDNIVHLVLARVEGSPVGTKGISCFIVPKFLVGDDGSLGARNDVKLISTEHKLGIHASPTCVLAFGEDQGGAVAELIGERDTGMRTMFTMMNNARLAVGQQGLAVAEAAYQLAVDHARSRVQGRPVGATETGGAIAGHPDVRRMLFTVKSHLEAMRALIFANAVALDLARHAPTEELRAAAQERADLLTPLSKAWCTDLGNELTSIALQVFGGMGYVEETGIAQLYRDVRIAAIYEGTNGIQALDLIGRKIGLRQGAAINDLLNEISGAADALDREPQLADLSTTLRAGVDRSRTTTAWMLDASRSNPSDAMAGATPYLRLLATTVGAGWMARQALAAVEGARSAADVGGYLAAKVATARFFIEQILPTTAGLDAQARCGTEPLFAIDENSLASS